MRNDNNIFLFLTRILEIHQLVQKENLKEISTKEKSINYSIKENGRRKRKVGKKISIQICIEIILPILKINYN